MQAQSRKNMKDTDTNVIVHTVNDLTFWNHYLTEFDENMKCTPLVASSVCFNLIALTSAARCTQETQFFNLDKARAIPFHCRYHGQLDQCFISPAGLPNGG